MPESYPAVSQCSQYTYEGGTMLNENERAFTMIELITVLAIVGVLVSFGFVRLSGFADRWNLDRTSDRISSTIRAAGNSASGENRHVRITVNLDKNKMRYEICVNRTDCDVSDDTDWETLSGLEPVVAEKPTLFYRFAERGGTVYVSGSHRFIVTPQGKVRSGFYAIHLTNKPIPDTSDRCKFRTVAIVPNTIHPRQYDYGRYAPFDEAPPDCI
ncbi:MAG: Tfp pilus assembly protein FimT/FimU [bacterium]